MNYFDSIIAFENGELENHEVYELFQNLVDTGMLWGLQGNYARIAFQLAKDGYIIFND